MVDDIDAITKCIPRRQSRTGFFLSPPQTAHHEEISSLAPPPLSTRDTGRAKKKNDDKTHRPKGLSSHTTQHRTKRTETDRSSRQLPPTRRIKAPVLRSKYKTQHIFLDECFCLPPRTSLLAPRNERQNGRRGVGRRKSEKKGPAVHSTHHGSRLKRDIRDMSYRQISYEDPSPLPSVQWSSCFYHAPDIVCVSSLRAIL